MATYTNLKYGSRGDEVKKMQQALIDSGYDLGSGGADGIFGAKTQAAVKQYQQNNGLAVDGIAGNNTLGKLYGSSEGTANTTTSSAPNTPVEQTISAYDPNSDTAYQQALAALTQAQSNAPTYANSYENQLNEIYNQIINRDKFSYDLNADMLYQQYKDQYINQGQMAMRDTMGQAAALTGGYGSSYSQAVGQQQYDAYLQQLNEIVPELYGMALDQYNAEGDALYNLYSLTGDMADDEYAKYQDAYNRWLAERDYAQSQADTAYDRGYNDWYTKYQMQLEAENTAYNRQQDAYANLVSLITSTGYTPNAEELAAAGMSSAQAQAYADYYKQSVTPSTTSSSGSSRSSGNSSGGSSYNNGNLTTAQVKALQSALGVTADGKYGKNSKSAAGGLSADEAYAKYVGGSSSGTITNRHGDSWVYVYGAGRLTYNELLKAVENGEIEEIEDPKNHTYTYRYIGN